MSETTSTRTLVEALFARIAAGDTPERIAAVFSEQVDWYIAGDLAAVPWIGRRHGRAGVAAFYRQIREELAPERFELRATVVEGEHAVVLGELASRVRRTGKLIETAFAFDLTVRDGRVVRCHMLEDSHAVALATRPDSPLSGAALDSARRAAVRAYFESVDAGDGRLLDLFTDDVAFFFPKFGEARGKQALVEFGTRMGRVLGSIQHDIDGFRYTASGDTLVVEGQERGTTRDGAAWPDPAVSSGRFCSVFGFSGTQISRMSIYVDPDFASADRARVAAFAGPAPAAG